MKNSYIEIKNVSKTIKNNVILDKINIKLEKGKIYGFRGKNGSGKTMLFRAICGLINVDEGEIIIDNKIIGKDISFPENLGILIEYPGFLPNLTGFKNLKYLADIKRIISKKDIEVAMEKVGLDPKDNRIYKKYSLGMKQRLGIAQAIMEDPDLIILDEPSNSLDLDGVKLINDIILELKKQGKTILIANHDKEELESIADDILLIDRGKIIKSDDIGESDK